MKKAIVAAGSLILIVAVFWICLEWFWRTHPEAAFQWITDRDLPVGVVITAYANEMDDDFFGTTHYWLLAGTPADLRKVIDGTGFMASDDAPGMMSQISRLFGLPENPPIVAGFEWELDRDHWYCIFEGETTAIYAH